MNCTDRKEQVSRFIDGELGVRDHVALFEHLAGCKECRGFLDAMLEVRDRSREETVRFPEELDNAVLSMIPSNHTAARPPRLPFWQRRITIPIPAALAGVLVLATLIVLLLATFNPQRDRSLETLLNLRQSPARPTTVILVYGLPEVQVVGPRSDKTKIEKILY